MSKLIALLDKVKKNDATVCILGLGRVGLPLVTIFATSGLRSIGIENNNAILEKIKKSECPFYDPSLQENLTDATKSEKLIIKTEFNESDNIDIFFVTVGTPTNSDNTTDYSQLYGALEQISKLDLSGKMIILRSTLPVKTTDEIVIPYLTEKTNLVVGEDFGVAVCPERILEGKAIKEIQELPEIIGGVNEISQQIASELFLKINPQKHMVMTTPGGAELAKLFTNIYRYINFALANEFAIWAEKYDLDAFNVINAANENYSRCNIPIPGFAGGPCLSKDGILLENNTTFSSIVSTAWKVNESVPQHIVNNLKEIVGNLYNKKITILGISFKAGSDDLRNSPSVKLSQILKSLGAKISIHDPYVKDTLSLSEALKEPEIIILATNHSVFREKINEIRDSKCDIIYDVWNLYKNSDFPDSKYYCFGKGL